MKAVPKRGRPAKNENKVNINDLVVEFLTTKANDYNANICYFKDVNVECKTKMKGIIGTISLLKIKTQQWTSQRVIFLPPFVKQ